MRSEANPTVVPSSIIEKLDAIKNSSQNRIIFSGSSHTFNIFKPLTSFVSIYSFENFNTPEDIFFNAGIPGASLQENKNFLKYLKNKFRVKAIIQEINFFNKFNTLPRSGKSASSANELVNLGSLAFLSFPRTLNYFKLYERVVIHLCTLIHEEDQLQIRNYLRLNISELRDMAQEADVPIYFVIFPNFALFNKVFTYTKIVSEVIAELNLQSNAIFLSNFMNQNEILSYMKSTGDNIHPNVEGYIAIALIISQNIKIESK